MNDLIDKRDERTRQRKAKKRKMDALIGLSAENCDEYKTLSASVATITDTAKTARLLDEGYCDNGFILKKGAIEKYLNGENEKVTGWEMVDGSWQRTEVLNLTDDFTGTVNLGHKDFSTDPFVLGEFKKSDLSVVDIEDDRKALDVNVRLDEESMFVKELRRQPYDIGVSAEFYYNVDWDATQQLFADYNIWMPVIDEIFIFAYGLVGECGNVNSSGLELGVNMVNEEIKTEELVVEEAPVEEPIENTTESDDAENIEELGGEEAEVEEVQEDDEDDGDEAYEETLAMIEDLRNQIRTLSEQVDSLTEANAELKKTNRKLNNKLKDEKSKKEKFIENTKDISVKLGVNENPEEKKVEKSMALGDGIGEING